MVHPQFQLAWLGLLLLSAILFISALGFFRLAPDPESEEGRYLVAGGLATATLGVVVGLTVWRPLRWGQRSALVASTLPFFTAYLPMVVMEARAGLLGASFYLASTVLSTAFIGSAVFFTTRSVLGLWGASPHRFFEARLTVGDSWKYTARGERNRAISSAEQAVALCPRCPETHTALAWGYAAAGQADKARDAYQAGLRACPNDWTLLVDLGDFEMGQQRYAEAESAFRRVVELLPNWVGAYVELSRCLSVQDRVDEAAGVLEQARAFSPEDTSVLERLGSIRYRQGHLDEGVALLSRAVQKSDASGVARNQLARALADSKRWDEALEQADRAYTIDPSDPEFKDSLGDLAFDLADPEMDAGRYPQAEAIYRKALELRPSEPWFYLRLAWTLTSQERFDEADALVQQAYDLAPNDPWVLSMLGSMEYRHGNPEEAIALLRQAAEAGHNSRANHHYLALALADSERWEEAETHASRALELAPDNTDLRALVDEIRAKLRTQGDEN